MSTSTNSILIKLGISGDAQVQSAFANLRAELDRVTKHHEALSVGMSRVGQLAVLLGGDQLVMLANQATRLTQVFGGLGKAMQTIGALRAGLIGVGIAGAAFGVQKFVGDREKEAERLKAQADAAKLLDEKMRGLAESQALLNQRMMEGVLKPDAAADLQKWIDDLRRFGASGEYGLKVIGTMDEKIRSVLDAVKSRDVAGLVDAHRSVGKVRAEAELETQRALIAQSLTNNQTLYDQQKVQLDGWLARRRQLVIEAHGLESKNIERQEFEARARLNLSDEVARQKALADLEKLNGQKKILAIKLESDMNAITAEGEAERKRIRETALENKKIADKMLLDIQQQSAEIQNPRAGQMMAEDNRHAAFQAEIAALQVNTDAKNRLREQGEWLHQQRISVIHQQFEDQRLALEKQHDMERARLRRDQFEATRKTLDDMSTTAQLFGRKGVAMAKGFAIASTLMSTYESAQKSYAAMASIPYVGPVLGAIAAAAATGAGLARVAQIRSSGGGYASGGYTGDIPANQVAGQVHGREFVFSAPEVERIGVDNLSALHEGSISLNSPAVNVGAPQVHVGMINSDAEKRRWLKSDPGVRKIIIDLINGSKFDLGMA